MYPQLHACMHYFNKHIVTKEMKYCTRCQVAANNEINLPTV